MVIYFQLINCSSNLWKRLIGKKLRTVISVLYPSRTISMCMQAKKYMCDDKILPYLAL